MYHYHESYIKQKWDLQEDDETEALVTTSSSLSSANDRHSQEGRGNGINGGGGGSGAAAFERRRIIVDTLEPSTPPSSSFLTTIPNPSSAYNNHNTSNMPASPSSSALTASLQKIQSMVHEQTERIRQVNYAEKKADFAEAVYEKSALWRVRGVEWGGLAKKAWEDRGGVGGIAGGLAERWRRRGDYPIIGGYNPEGKTTGHVDQIFGIPLAEAVKHSRISPSTGVPAVVTRCIEYLDVMGVEEVGLYRISGSSTTVAKMKALFDQGQDYDFLQKGHEPPNPHDVATLLKLYLRELPAPIIPATLLPAFTQAASSDDPGPALRDQLKQLPLENYLLLATLSRHLSTLADYEAVTKMSISNLGLIFCPTLQIGSALFKQLLGGDEPTSTKKHTSGCALVPITSTTSAGDNYTSPTEDHRDDEEDGMRTLQQDVDGERKALRERQLAVVWADKEARHEEMENLELVKDFELALEMQQDEEKQLQLQKQQQLQQTLQQEATSHEHTNRHQQHHHQDLEWDRVDDFEDDCSFESSKAAAAAPTSSLSTSAPPPSTAAQSPPLIDLYDEMVMREIDEAASTPLITPPQTIRSAPLPSVPRRQPFQQSPQQQQQQRRRHAREPAAVLDQSIGTSMGRSLILEGSSRNDVEDGEEDDDNNGAEGGSNTRMSRSLYTSTEAHVRAQEDTRPRRSRPPPTFLAGVGMASPTSPPLSTSRFSPSTTPGNNGNGPSANGDTASTRRTNAGYIGNNSNSSSPKHANSTTSHGGVTNMNGSNNNSISPKQQQQQQQQRPRMTTNDRSFSGGSLSNSLSSASSAAIITTAAITNNATANATAAVFHDLFARPAQPTVSREDARGTKIKRIVNPFENMAASSSITAGTPPGLHPPPPPPTLSSSHAFSSTSSTPLASRTSQTSPTSESTWTSSPHVNEYVQQLQLHEEDNIRTTLDSSARHRRQPAGFERIGIVGHGDAR
ncbi:hypothetical protein BGW41_002034 [Actinomortierella wolfii]|nr:hypothetical protein BGW41_002034 [Actinomortierella wolfii]